MTYNILAVGDVVGESGLEHLLRHLGSLKKEKNIHFTVVNGENASNVGVMPQQVEQMTEPAEPEDPKEKQDPNDPDQPDGGGKNA